MARPSRSDVHLQPDEARKVEEEARRYFEVLLPKRHPKPFRSEPFSDDLAAGTLQPSAGVPIPPEFVKLQELSADPQKLVCEGVEVAEDYVQTEYYAGLHSIDKHHHTTGTGFIKVYKPSGSCLNLTRIFENGSPPTCKWNPATNDWIPSADPVHVIPVSHKPSRSES